MKKTFKIFLFILMFAIFSNTFADSKTKLTYSPYEIGQALGKISHKSFDAMNNELVKKDFISGFDDTILDKKPDYDKISDQDSYEVGMIIATQYKQSLKKLVKMNKENSQEFVKGFDSAADAKDTKLTSQDEQILKHFKKLNDD